MQTPPGLSISLSVNAEATQLILKLGLQPLPREGGFFAATWLSADKTASGRPAGSGILFLITPEGFSALHRLKTAETWHYHAGDPAELALLDPATGRASRVVLGPDVLGAHRPFAVAPGGVWQGARILPGAPGRGWTLFSCTMSPAWDEREFELGDRSELSRAFPTEQALVRGLTRADVF